MGAVMVKCPNTVRNMLTGRIADRAVSILRLSFSRGSTVRFAAHSTNSSPRKPGWVNPKRRRSLANQKD